MPDPHLLLHLTWGVEITAPWTYLPKTPNDSHKDCRSSFGAENGARTRDLNLGKVALYQLSYFRIAVSGLQI